MEMVSDGVLIEHVELSGSLCGPCHRFQRIERPPIVNQNGHTGVRRASRPQNSGGRSEGAWVSLSVCRWERQFSWIRVRVACNACSPGSLLAALSTALDGSINAIFAMVRNARASHWLSEFVIGIALFPARSPACGNHYCCINCYPHRENTNPQVPPPV
jgi:hypothetical protein